MKEYEDLAPNFKKSLMTKMKEESPYWALLGMELVDVKKGWCSVRLPFSRKLLHPLGIAHGGAVFSAADSAVALAMLGIVSRETTFTTVEMKINYMKPFNKGEIVAEAKIISSGSRIAVADVEVVDGEQDLIAKCLATYMINNKE